MSDIQSADEILNKLIDYVGGNGTSKQYTKKDAIADLTRREERIKVETRIDEFDIFTAEVIRQAVSGTINETNLSDRRKQLEQELKTLDGQENTNGK